ncbi:MAG TPA: NUDIX domain-containing protein [Acidimicrobiales bacterium]|nr:NUDIX domain-containing protein [Acidimicrobiales bacterium]
MPAPDEGSGGWRADIERFDARSAREERSRAQIRRELDRLGDPLDRYADRVHVTGSAIVIGPRGTVLHVHKRVGRWIQPGGHLEPGESPADAALREAVEETGLPLRHPDGDPRLFHLDAHPAPGGHVHLDLRYLLVSDDVEPAPPPGESQDVRWFSIDEAIAVADEALVDALERVRAPHPRPET